MPLCRWSRGRGDASISKGGMVWGCDRPQRDRSRRLTLSPSHSFPISLFPHLTLSHPTSPPLHVSCRPTLPPPPCPVFPAVVASSDPSRHSDALRPPPPQSCAPPPSSRPPLRFPHTHPATAPPFPPSVMSGESASRTTERLPAGSGGVSGVGLARHGSNGGQIEGASEGGWLGKKAGLRLAWGDAKVRAKPQ